jgi:hypothetical protein
MTEAEWLAATDSADMVNDLFLVEDLPCEISKRRLLLFAAGCCRTALNHLDAVICGQAVEMAERFIEGGATREQVSEKQRQVDEHKWAQPQSEQPFWFAVSSLCEMDGWQAAEDSSAPMSDHPLLKATATNILRCVFGNPFRPVTIEPSWLTSDVRTLAEGIYQERAFDRMPILADALQDAGCDNDDILNHCRQPGEHVRGCWVVDLILGKS